MDICPAYWNWLDKQFDLGFAASIQMIGEELKNGNDELSEWAKARPEHFINNDDIETQEVFINIVQIVMTGDYNIANRDNFLDKADPWIIAKAKTLNATVVTHEVSQLSTKKVKIPDICKQFNVPCLNTFQFLRELDAKFVLEK